MTHTTASGETYAAHADLDGTLLMAEEPEVERCWLCLHEATTTAPIGPDEDVPVCGLHS